MSKKAVFFSALFIISTIASLLIVQKTAHDQNEFNVIEHNIVNTVSDDTMGIIAKIVNENGGRFIVFRNGYRHAYNNEPVFIIQNEHQTLAKHIKNKITEFDFPVVCRFHSNNENMKPMTVWRASDGELLWSE